MEEAGSRLVDLVAEPAEPLAAPEEMRLGETTIRVASRRELLATKLCSLLHRSEPRDLQDVQALLLSGSSLEQGLADAPLVDGGFSAMTLARVLQGLDILALASAASISRDPASELDAFRLHLIDRLAEMSRPG